MNNYTPPYKITSKILKLSTQISEELIKLQFVPENDPIKYAKAAHNG